MGTPGSRDSSDVTPPCDAFDQVGTDRNKTLPSTLASTPPLPLPPADEHGGPSTAPSPPDCRLQRLNARARRAHLDAERCRASLALAQETARAARAAAVAADRDAAVAAIVLRGATAAMALVKEYGVDVQPHIAAVTDALAASPSPEAITAVVAAELEALLRQVERQSAGLDCRGLRLG